MCDQGWDALDRMDAFSEAGSDDAELGIQSEPPCTGDVRLGGEWLYFRSKDASAGEELLRKSPDTWQEAHHASTLYLLHRISVCGLSAGWNLIQGAPAIHTHPLKCDGKCMGYAAYVHLFQDGVYVAIKFRLAVMRRGTELNGRRTTTARARHS